uniref:Uncharacterized protein n=1 Tax=Papilio polytes TaxID=76194 RepID=I4DMS6_PAPPL|nr:unknown secreted protein [Papilio polytes]
MRPINKFPIVCSLFVCLVQMTASGMAGTQFSSHVSVSTPSRSFSHGVGDPVPLPPAQQKSTYRNVRRPTFSDDFGYPRVKPAIPFVHEDIVRNKPYGPPSLHNFFDAPIPVLPPSPYKVDSPDPESLWPEGLFVPPLTPPRFGLRRVDAHNLLDPYLLEGSEAVAAVRRADHHGHFFFHDIPHIESLLANQNLRVKNKLKPHRIGSIRNTWPYNRP